MTNFFGSKTNTPNAQRALSRLMMTSALVAAGTLVLSTSAMAEPWADVTGPGFTNTSGGANVTNIVATTANGKASGTGNLDILGGQTVNINAKLFVARDNRDTIQTSILGNLNSNGTVVLVDRNGVVFGKDSRIDVGRIIASTGDVSDAQALADADTPLLFSNFGTGEIVNNGVIKSIGTAGDYGLVAFVGPVVKNNGVITAYKGRVALAAGNETATVDLYGDGLVSLAYTDKNDALKSENAGKIEAFGGTIQMTAAAAKDVVDSVVNMNGIARADSATVVGGKIVLSAKNVNVGAYSSVKGNTQITAKSAKLGSTIDGTVTGSADSVKVLSNNAKIAQALNIVNANGTVDVAAGTYNEHLVVDKAGVTLKGANAGISGSGVRGAETIINPNSPGVTVTADDVTVDGLLISDALGADGYGLFVNNADNVTLKNNVIKNTSQSGIYVLNSDDATITDNNIGATGAAGNIQADGIRLIRGNGALIIGNEISNVGTAGTGFGSGVYAVLSDDLGIGGNVISNTAWDGIKLVSSDNAVVVGNSTENVARAGFSVELSDATTYFLNQSVNSGLWGVWAQASTNLDIIGNYIDGVAGEHGIYINGGTNVLIDNNFINDTKLAGIHADSVLGNDDGSLTISNNTIDNTGSFGVWVYDSAETSITGNEIGTLGGAGNIKNDGIRIVASNDSVVQSNVISNTKPTISNGTGSGIYSLLNDNIIIGGLGLENTISNADWDGIKVEGGSDVQVLGNFISGSGRAGISMYLTTNATVDGVTQIENSNKWGIYSARNTGLSITNSNINGVTQFDGINSFDDANLFVSNVTIADTGMHGIYVDSAKTSDSTPSALLTYNNIDNTGNATKTGGHGIYVLSSDDANVSYNRIGTLGGTGNIKGDGVRGVFDNNLRVHGNIITETAPAAVGFGSGVYVMYSNDVGITFNRISNTKWDGVKIGFGNNYRVQGNEIFDITRAGISANDTTDAFLAGNTLSNLGRWGVWSLNNDGLIVSGNTITDVALFDGITSENDSNSIFRFNTISGAARNGIYALNAFDGLSILSNNISDSAVNGIEIEDASGLVTIDANTITNSAVNGILVHGGSPIISTPTFAKLAPSQPIELYITGNTVSNSAPVQGFAAVNLDISSDGYAALSDNTLGNNFDYGLVAYSGTIDLTGASNTIQNTDIGMGFYPVDPLSLRLVNDTIGTTAFIDQASLFVDLGTGAMFDPGTPTLLDGNNATYTLGGVTIDPATFGGVTQAEYDLLQIMLNDFNDTADRGLFFFNILPDTAGIAIDQKDVLRNFFSIPTPDVVGGNLTITGLPSVGGAGAPAVVTPVAFNPNAIEPAAGDEEGAGTAGDVANIQPAAGGDTACWSDATASLGQGAPVTFNFGATGTDMLQNAATCGTGQAADAQSL